MCGIAGVLTFKPKTIDRSNFINSINKLSLRGPDSEGIYEFDHGFLGHRRLSIIDTSTSANQPMADSTNRYTIVFNGEIFNYKQLKSTHLASENFKTQSDTEVLLKLFLKYKEECLPMLDGFFAFAIYDNLEKKVFIARDRYGKKPLVYFINDEGFFFASELKALYPLGLKKEIDMDIVHLYFQLNYIPQPFTIFKNVSKLGAGQYAQIDLNQIIKISTYYEPKVEIDTTLSYENACLKLHSLLAESVEKRLISDVPLGAFLSGGIDSSVIVALSSQYVKSLNTFSIGFKDNPIYDETYYANLVAKKFNTTHTVFSLTNQDYLDHVFDVLDYLDEPFADSSAIPVYILSKLTRKHVTVALSGDGGDEVFSGYNKHLAEWKARKTNSINTIIKNVKPFIEMLPQGRSSKLANLSRQLNRYADGISLQPKDRYWKWATFYSDQDLTSLFSGSSHQQINHDRLKNIQAKFTENITHTDFNETLISDIKLVLEGDMLVKVDLMSMANSLEVRSPFLDHHVVDYAFTLPTEYKINGQLKKRIVQDTFRNVLPSELYNRPKQGFEIPMKNWFQNELRSLIEDDLLNDAFIIDQNIFDIEYTKDLKNRLFKNIGNDVTWRVWSLIVFQYWYKKYFI